MMDSWVNKMHIHASLFKKRHGGGPNGGGYGGVINAPPINPEIGGNGGNSPFPGGNGGAATGSTPSPGLGSGATGSTDNDEPSSTSAGPSGGAQPTGSSPSDPQITGAPGGGPGGSGSGSGVPGTGSGGGSSSSAESSTSKSGLPPGAIAGIVVGLLALLAILALLLFKFRKSSIVQRMLAPFARLAGKGSLVQPNPRDSMGNNLLAAGAGAAALAAGNRNNTPSPQPPMTETGTVSPIVTAPAAASQPRILTPSPTDQMFAVTPASPLSSGGYLSPTTAMPAAATIAAAAAAASRYSKPLPPPPPKDMRASTMTNMSQASMGSSLSMGSTVMSPNSMSWPMPPISAPISPPISPLTTATSPRSPQHRQDPSLSSSQWISMDQPGQTVVRITNPRRPGA